MEEADEEHKSTSTHFDEVRQKIVLHVYDDESQEFTSLTTYHGMIRIYSSETWPSRIFWSLVVVTCLTLFMIHSGLMLLFYHSHPTFFKTTNVLITEANLPWITVCKVGGEERWRKYPQLQSQKHLLIALNSVSIGDSFRVNETQDLELFEELYMKIMGEKFCLRKFFKDNRIPCEKFVKSIRIGGRIVYNYCGISHWSLTDVGFCSTFKWEQVSSSIRIDVVSEADELVLFRVHPENTVLTLNTEGLYVPRGKSAKLVIQPRKKIHLKTSEWGDCVDEIFHDAIYPDVRYNTESCEIHCVLKHYIEQCGCVPFFADAQDFRYCNLTETVICRRKNQNNDKRKCQCPIECEKMDYSHSVLSYLKTNQRNLSSIEIQMQSRHLQVDQQFKRIKAVDLLSYVAGSMGLLLGMSCVTLLEIFIYLFKSVWGVFNGQRHKLYYLENLLGVSGSENSMDSHDEIVITTKPRGESTLMLNPSRTSVMELNSGIDPQENSLDQHHPRLNIEVVHHPLGRRRSSYAHHLAF